MQFTAQLCKNYIGIASEWGKEHFKSRAATRENAYLLILSSKHVSETVLLKR